MTTISITQEDIVHGKRGDCNSCAVARALKRVIPCADVSVGATVATFYNSEDQCIGEIALPIEARDFIKKFDVGYPVKPMMFTVEEI